jgi:hypothetical protein
MIKDGATVGTHDPRLPCLPVGDLFKLLPALCMVPAIPVDTFLLAKVRLKPPGNKRVLGHLGIENVCFSPVGTYALTIFSSSDTDFAWPGPLLPIPESLVRPEGSQRLDTLFDPHQGQKRDKHQKPGLDSPWQDSNSYT